MAASYSSSEDFKQFMKSVTDRAKHSQPPRKTLKRQPSFASLTSSSSSSSCQSVDEGAVQGHVNSNFDQLLPEDNKDKSEKKEKKRNRLTSSKCAEHVAEDIAKVFSLSTDVKFALGFYSLFNTAEQKSVKKALKVNVEKLMDAKEETETGAEVF